MFGDSAPRVAFRLTRTTAIHPLSAG